MIGSLRTWVCGCALWLLPVAAWAQSEAEELGHHWEVPKYLGEVRLQLAGMVLLTCLIVAGTYLGRVLKKRGAH